MLAKHPCMSCNKNPATVKLTKIADGNAQELWLCQQCAAEQSPYAKKMPLNIETILANILGAQKSEAAAKPVVQVDLSCKTCGLPFDSYRTTLLLGCSDCYESFEAYLSADLRKFHGSIIHRGRVPMDKPATFEPARRDPQELRKRLQDAVEAEDFELAAKLRDELREAESSRTSDQ